MTKILIALLLILFGSYSALAFSTDGQETQNGGGTAEQNFAYALTILKPLYQACISINHCLKDKRQLEILKRIHGSIDVEIATPSFLIFVPGDWPNFFRDGQMRVAVTGSKVGNTIFLNRDLIYRKVDGALVPYSLGEAIGLLTHELGHHQGELDHNLLDLLDLLGANVRAFYESQKQTITVDNFSGYFANSKIQLEVFHFRQTEMPFAHLSSFWLLAGGRYFDLNKDIRKQIACPDYKSANLEIKGYRFFQMHWEDPISLPSGRIQYPLEAKVWMECEQVESGIPIAHRSLAHRARITVDFFPVGNKLFYFNGSVKVEVEKIN